MVVITQAVYQRCPLVPSLLVRRLLLGVTRPPLLTSVRVPQRALSVWDLLAYIHYVWPLPRICSIIAERNGDWGIGGYMTRRRMALLVFFAILTAQSVVIVPAQAARACFGKTATILGTNGKDRLRGTPRADVIVGRGGRDRIHGRGGNDRICGADGHDTLRGGPGKDRVKGNGGSDVLWGDGGNDVLIANKGRFHSFYPGGGNDVVRGSRNKATLAFDDVDYINSPRSVNVDLAAGTATGYGSDSLRRIDDAFGSKFDDTLRGTGTSNLLVGRRGDDTILGRGNPPRGISTVDLLDGGPGNDNIDGGAGLDVGGYFFANKRVTVDLGAGTAVGQGNDTLASIEGIDGTRFADRLTGDGGNNPFQGGAGNDRISGAGGRDAILHFGARRGVRVNLEAGTSSGSGTDSLDSIENVYGSFNNDRIRGDGNANSVRGLAGKDTLLGLGGDDTLRGQAGKDTINGGAGNDACAGEAETNCERDPSVAARRLSTTRSAWFAIRGRV
jgi:Ca2+-binding RTX toxin-like protein